MIEASPRVEDNPEAQMRAEFDLLYSGLMDRPDELPQEAINALSLAHAIFSKVEAQKLDIAERDTELGEHKDALEVVVDQAAQKDAEIAQKDAEIAQKDAEITQKDAEIAQKDAKIAEQGLRLDEANSKLADSSPAGARLAKPGSKLDEDRQEELAQLMPPALERSNNEANNPEALEEHKQWDKWPHAQETYEDGGYGSETYGKDVE